MHEGLSVLTTACEAFGVMPCGYCIYGAVPTRAHQQWPPIPLSLRSIRVGTMTLPTLRDRGVQKWRLTASPNASSADMPLRISVVISSE